MNRTRKKLFLWASLLSGILAFFIYFFAISNQVFDGIEKEISAKRLLIQRGIITQRLSPALGQPDIIITEPDINKKTDEAINKWSGIPTGRAATHKGTKRYLYYHYHILWIIELDSEGKLLDYSEYST